MIIPNDSLDVEVEVDKEVDRAAKMSQIYTWKKVVKSRKIGHFNGGKADLSIFSV